jgi:hypothetical protein
VETVISKYALVSGSKPEKQSLAIQIAISLGGFIVDLLVAGKLFDISAFIALAVIYIFASFVIPNRNFFGLILSSAVFCPIHYFGFTGFLGYVPLTMSVVLITSLRNLKFFGFQKMKGFYLASIFVFAFSVLSGLLNNASLVFLLVNSAMVSFVWILGPKLLSRSNTLVENKVSILIVAFSLGLVSLFEYSGKTNILGWYFAGSDLGLIQKWGGFRILTVLGHPLINGLVFAILGVFTLVFLLERFSIAVLSAFLLVLFALALTTSRSGITAFFAGAATALVIRAIQRKLKIAPLLALGAAALMISSYFNPNDLFSRFTTAESTSSNDYRFYILTQVKKIIAAKGLIGGGPLSSASTWSKIDPSGLPLENSILQIITSQGMALALFGFVCLLLALRARYKQGLVNAAPVVITYFVCSAGFNLYEAYPSMLLVLILVMSFVYKPADELLTR